jgi:hypothetical protein
MPGQNNFMQTEESIHSLKLLFINQKNTIKIHFQKWKTV